MTFTLVALNRAYKFNIGTLQSSYLIFRLLHSLPLVQKVFVKEFQQFHIPIDVHTDSPLTNLSYMFMFIYIYILIIIQTAPFYSFIYNNQNRIIIAQCAISIFNTHFPQHKPQSIINNNQQSMTYRDTDISRKRSAFRQRIRKDYLQNMFKQRRLQFTELEQQQHNKTHDNKYHIKELAQFTVNSAQKSNNFIDDNGGNRYPFTSQQIPQLDIYEQSQAITGMRLKPKHKGEGGTREIMKNTKFQNYQQFTEYLDVLFKLLPSSSTALVLLLNNNPGLIPQLMKYLFAITEDNDHHHNNNHDKTGQHDSPAKKLQFHSTTTTNHINNINAHSSSKLTKTNYPMLTLFIDKFIECSVPQYMNYLHILQNLLVHLFKSCPQRTALIKGTSTKICGKIASLLNTNRIFRVEIYKGYFEYLITLGDDVRMLTRVEIITAADAIKDVFGKFYSEPSENMSKSIYQQQSSLLCTAITACNNILSIRSQPQPQPQTNQNSKLIRMDTIYKTTQIKQFFIVELLRSPNCIHNIIACTMNSPDQFHMEHYLRTLVNLTYLMAGPSQLHPFVQYLAVMIRCILGQHLVLGGFTVINTLVLRCVNNVVVNDRVSAQVIWKEGIIDRIIRIYGGWLVKQLYQEKVPTQPTPQVYVEFISTLTTYIILLYSPAHDEEHEQQNTSNNKHKSPVEVGTNFTENLETLLSQNNITLLLLESLKLDYISGRNSRNGAHEDEQVSNIFEALVVLHNFEQGDNRNSSSVAKKLIMYQEVIQQIVAHYSTEGQTMGNVGALGESLLEIINIQQDRQEEHQARQQEMNKQKEMYEEIRQERERMLQQQQQSNGLNNNKNMDNSN